MGGFHKVTVNLISLTFCNIFPYTTSPNIFYGCAERGNDHNWMGQRLCFGLTNAEEGGPSVSSSLLYPGVTVEFSTGHDRAQSSAPVPQK